MARAAEASPVYEAGRLFRQRCLSDGTSLLWPHTKPWTPDNLNALHEAFVGHPDTGKRTFLQKWHDQLARQPADVHRVGANVVMCGNSAAKASRWCAKEKGVPFRLTLEKSFRGGTPFMVARYRVSDVNASNVAGTIVDALDQLARDGARQMLQRALEAEVQEFLGRERYQRGPEFRGYRNGHGRERTVGIGTWAVPVKVPRVSDTPEGSAFESAVLPKRTRLSMETQKLYWTLDETTSSAYGLIVLESEEAARRFKESVESNRPNQEKLGVRPQQLVITRVLAQAGAQPSA